LAAKYGAGSQWISAIENTIQENLKSWGLIPCKATIRYRDDQSRVVENIRLEQQLKGNLLLLATIDGRERKFIIRKKTMEYDRILLKGITHLSDEDLKTLVSKFLA
jgi:serine/threonine-protein kinase HipA